MILPSRIKLFINLWLINEFRQDGIISYIMRVVNCTILRISIWAPLNKVSISFKRVLNAFLLQNNFK
jgi:hypothetical protein